jgi:hypothetical protein
VVARLVEAAVDDMLARYDLGLVLSTLRRLAPRAVGAKELNSMAKWMGIHASALRRYARVTETIDRAEFAHLLGLRNAHGTPLTWSHVECLALEGNAARRKVLAIAIAEEDLSVRALAARLRR